MPSYHSQETIAKMRATAIRNGNQPPGMIGRKHTEESKLKISLSRKGKNTGVDNPMWKGGISPLNYAERRRFTREYKRKYSSEMIINVRSAIKAGTCKLTI